MSRYDDRVPERTIAEVELEERKRIRELQKEMERSPVFNGMNAEQRAALKKMRAERALNTYVRLSDQRHFKTVASIQREHPTVALSTVWSKLRAGNPIQGEIYQETRPDGSVVPIKSK